jgi:hypothetical protein
VPKEYYANEVVSDCCDFLRRPQPARVDALELPEVRTLVEALKPLAAIADAFDENELDDEARKYWGTSGVCEVPHDQIELYQGRGGNQLLTLADCMKARSALVTLKGGA